MDATKVAVRLFWAMSTVLAALSVGALARVYMVSCTVVLLPAVSVAVRVAVYCLLPVKPVKLVVSVA